MEKKYCLQCRSLLSEGDKTCSICGFETVRISEPKTIIQYPNKSKSEPNHEEVISKNKVQSQYDTNSPPKANEDSKLKNSAESAEGSKNESSDSDKEKNEENNLHNDFEVPFRVPSLRKSVYNKTLPALE